jgi:hypothetical protein
MTRIGRESPGAGEYKIFEAGNINTVPCAGWEVGVTECHRSHLKKG